MLEYEVAELLQPPPAWTDTVEQAQMRSCLARALAGHEPAETVRVASEMITMMRDQLLANLATVRRVAAGQARESMSPGELAQASGQSRQTISRLLTEARSR